MISLHTEVRVFDSELSIGRDDVLLMIGSCFADHIGHFFQKHKFKVLTNPLGIVFNPHSLSKNLIMAKDLTQVTGWEDLIVQHDGLWHSLLHHSIFSQPSKSSLVNLLNQSIAKTQDWLVKADYVIITLGSAHVYRHLSTGEIVSNCHKLPAAQFRRELLTSEAISSCLNAMFDTLRSINSKLQFILTVSPVRYIRDGLVASNRSKAHLLSSVHALVEQLDFCHYFPAYEVVIDELRDYRFFQTDMVHPSEQAVGIVMQRFVDHWVNEGAKEQIKLLGTLNRSMQHRPLHPEGEAFQRFIDQLKLQIQELSARYPDLSFLEEIELLSNNEMI